MSLLQYSLYNLLITFLHTLKLAPAPEISKPIKTVIDYNLPINGTFLSCCSGLTVLIQCHEV